MPKWDELTPRQRDVAIAKLLGWHVETVGSAPMGYEGPHVSHPWQQLQHIPHYTTDPAAALQLAEAMREKGCRYKIITEPDCFLARWPLDTRYEVFLTRVDPKTLAEWCDQAGYGKSNTLAEAIAHAAFITLGGEE